MLTKIDSRVRLAKLERWEREMEFVPRPGQDGLVAPALELDFQTAGDIEVEVLFEDASFGGTRRRRPLSGVDTTVLTRLRPA